MNKNILRGIIIPLVAIVILATNLTFIENSECLRLIHIVTLLVMGIATGILGMNVITILKNKS